jgi:hypothetical protein
LKRKRGKADASHENPERKSKWKVGTYLKENVIQATSTLSTFSGVNIVSVHEVVEVLDAVKARITELETTLETIKGTMDSEYSKESL